MQIKHLPPFFSSLFIVLPFCPLNPSAKLGGGGPPSILDSIRRVKMGEHLESLKSSFSMVLSQPSELSYLNVTSPDGARDPRDQEDSLSVASEEA